MQSGRCSFPLQLPVYSKKELDLHLAKHLRCRLCNRWFYDTEDLQEHLDAVHEHCSICREDFLGSNALAEHLRWEVDFRPLSALWNVQSCICSRLHVIMLPFV
jgi:hypothetical protein